MESAWKGIGGRDAAKGVKGLGCPLYAGPWNGDGAREVWRRSRQTRMSGVLSLWLLSLCTRKEKVTRREGEKRSFGIKWGLFPIPREGEKALRPN